MTAQVNTTKTSSLTAKLESKTNKVTSLSSSNTHNQYASAKAIVDYIDSVIGNLDQWILEGAS